jgi:uncharacterized protein YggE
MNDQMNDEKLPHAIVRASRSVRYTATAALALLALFLLVATVAAAQGILNYTTTSPNTITVTGEGTATAAPDTATISFGATATAADVETAQTQVATAINSALATVKADGVASSDITTDSFSVSPHYSTTCTPVAQPAVASSGIGTSMIAMAPVSTSISNPPVCSSSDSVITGYDVSETVDVKITDLTKVSTILDGLAKAKVTNITGPNFVLGDPQAVEAQARGIAIGKAQTEAQTLAAQLHVRLGKVTSYSDNSNGGSPVRMMAMAVPSASGSTGVTVPVGQNTYDENVSITYEIH